ncbi:hypothetical protein K438DRAFT_2025356 [Mycena galopus ATCC 62051]|nr:hypothetical protein K438DRAFT_2025356 [Mycena galopus ATCC 62051]
MYPTENRRAGDPLHRILRLDLRALLWGVPPLYILTTNPSQRLRRPMIPTRVLDCNRHGPHGVVLRVCDEQVRFLFILPAMLVVDVGNPLPIAVPSTSLAATSVGSRVRLQSACTSSSVSSRRYYATAMPVLVPGSPCASLRPPQYLLSGFYRVQQYLIAGAITAQ